MTKKDTKKEANVIHEVLDSYKDKNLAEIIVIGVLDEPGFPLDFRAGKQNTFSTIHHILERAKWNLVQFEEAALQQNAKQAAADLLSDLEAKKADGGTAVDTDTKK
jgi:hypothetical protein